MLIGMKDSGIKMYASLVEPSINHEASNYIMNHYGELIAIIRKQEIKEEKAQDLLHDVYISIVEAEAEGNGFDMEYGSRINEDGEVEYNIMNVEQFVIGRIKLYAKNTKYRTDIVDGTTGSITETRVYWESELDKNGQEIIGNDGKKKLIKKVEKCKVPVMVTMSAASFNDGGDVEENNDEFQKAFAMASTSDSTDDVTDTLSLREQIDYCIDVCDMHGVNILNVFKNIDTLVDMLGEYSKKKKTAESVFAPITELIGTHDELASNLMEVLLFSSRNRAAFDAIIATY